MVGAVEHMLSPHNFVAAFKRSDVIADGINVECAEIMIDGALEEVLRKDCRWSSIAFDASRKVGDDTSDVGHDQL